MTTRQLLLRLKNILLARTWLGTGDVVFAVESVLTTVRNPEDVWDRIRLPGCLLFPGSYTADKWHPDLLLQQVTALLIVAKTGDRYGENALVGAHRQSKTTGAGRGLLEVEVELFDAVQQLQGNQGVSIRSIAASGALPEILNSRSFLNGRQYVFSAKVTTYKQWEEPRGVAAVNAAGTVTISWAAPDSTTDLITYVVRRNSGSVPVAFIGDGTSVAMGSALDLSTTDAPGSGTWTYSVFGHYADAGAAVALHPSDYGYATVTV